MTEVAADQRAAWEQRWQAEESLVLWAAANRQRDELIRAAVAAGVPKGHIHALTGLARTTIDRIVLRKHREQASDE